MVDDLRSRCPNIAVAFLYADYRDQTNQTLGPILGTILHQLLATASESIPDEITRKLRNIWRVDAEDNLALLRIRLQQLKHAFICIDAIDELEPKVRRQLLNALKELKTNNTRLFLTGRDNVKNDIQEYFLVTEVVISANEQDIENFVRKQINNDPYPGAMDAELEKDITDAIINKSQGM